MAEEKCAEVEESICKELLEQLGYIVDMPRKITENQACVGNRLYGIRPPFGMSAVEMREWMGGTFRDAVKQCFGALGEKTEEREAMLERLRNVLEAQFKDLEEHPERKYIERWIKENQSKIRRIEAGMP